MNALKTHYITQNSAKASLIAYLLKDQSQAFNVHFENLTQTISPLRKQGMEAFLYACAEHILNHASELDKLSVLSEPSSLDEMIRFMTWLIKHHYSLDNFPEHDEKSKLLKRLVAEMIHEHPLNGIQDDLHQIKDASSYVLVEQFIKEEEYQWTRALLDKGAQVLKIPRYAPRYHAFKAKNPRHEAEVIAQMIDQCGLDLNQVMVVCLDDNVQESLMKACDNLGIPYRSHNSQPLRSSRLMTGLIQYLEKPGFELLSDLIRQSLWSNRNQLAFLTYSEIIPLRLEDCLKPFNHFQTLHQTILEAHQLNEYIRLEKDADEFRKQLADFIQSAEKVMDLKERIQKAYELLSSLKQDRPDELYQIKQFVEKHYPYLDKDAYQAYFIHQLEKLKIQHKTTKGFDLCGIQDAFLFEKKLIFVAGCIQANYPAYPRHQGLFDERTLASYLKQNATERYRRYMTQLESVFTLAPEVVFSYAIGTYEGKNTLLSFEIESYLLKQGISQWELREPQEKEGGYRIEEVIELSRDQLQKQFFKDGALSVSVSAFENYFENPYAFYLEKGLGLGERPLSQWDALVWGSFQHSFLDQMTKRYRKQYPVYALQQLDDVLNAWLNELIQVFPRLQFKRASMKLRMKKSLESLLNYLQRFEEQDPFIPEITEKRILQNIAFDEGHIQFRGIVDRLDYYDGIYRMIDYKSSKHSLNRKDLQQGRKLQLPSYWTVLNQEGMHPFIGLYYQKLSQSRKTLLAMDKNKHGVDDNQEDMLQSMLDENYRLEGINFSLNSRPVQFNVKGDTNPKSHLEKEEVQRLISLAYQRLIQDFTKESLRFTPEPITLEENDEPETSV